MTGRHYTGFAFVALDYMLDRAKEIVLVKPSLIESVEPFVAKLRAAFVPNRVLTIVSQGKDLEQQEKVIPLLQSKTAIDGKVTAYVCEQKVCSLPTADPVVLDQQICKVQPYPPDL